MRSIRRPLAILVLASGGLLALPVAGAQATLPRGLRTPGLGEASQIIKYSGATVHCETIVVDVHRPKWAFVTAKSAHGCPAPTAPMSFAIVYESMPRNVSTVGVAWTPVYQSSSPRCPLPEV